MTPTTPYRLDGRSCMVTGPTSGIGRVAALELARAGASLALVCRDPERAEATRAQIVAETGNREVEVFRADLSSLAQVREVAERFLATGRPLHVLLNNAGVVNLRREETADGHEGMFGINHLAPYLLTNLLLSAT